MVDMHNQSIAPLSAARVFPLPANPAGSLLSQFMPGVAEQIGLASQEMPERVPYAVRDAINNGLNDVNTEKLIAVLQSMPRSEQTYTRHILHADLAGRFTVAALVWGHQQFSPVHAHHTWCAYRVLTGELTESHFEWDKMAQEAYLFNKVKRQAGQSVCGQAGLELIHRLGNANPQPAISIHVYGVDAEKISSHVNHVLSWSEKI